MSEFIIEAAGIRAKAERKDVRNIRLTIKPPDGEVFVSIPRRASVEAVKRFITEKSAWIKEKQNVCRARSQNVKRNVNDNSFMLWGKTCPVTVVCNAPCNSAELENETVVICVRDALTDELRTKLLDELCRSQLMERMAKVTPEWEKVTGVKANEWRTRIMKTRWGSCNVREKRIWINVRLAMLPPECLDKVIVHELCHLYETGHTPRFRALMDKFYPDWRRVRRRINELSQVLL